MFRVTRLITNDDIKIINYENFSYIIKTSKDYDAFFRSPLLIINNNVANVTLTKSVTWYHNPKYVMRVSFSVYYTEQFGLNNDKQYSFMVPMELLDAKEAKLREDFVWYASSLIDGVIYVKSDILTNIKININKSDEIVKTPWCITDKSSANIDSIKQLVWIRKNGTYSLGCIPIDSLHNKLPIKLIGTKIQLIYSWEHLLRYPKLCNIDEQNTAPNNIDDCINYLRNKSPRVTDIVLDYLIDEFILFEMAELQCLKKFMDSDHFKLINKSQFSFSVDSDNFELMSYGISTKNDNVDYISNVIMKWITNKCTNAILNLIPILVNYGYINEIATAICKSNDYDYINLIFGKHMKFHGSHIMKEYKLFGENTNINPIGYCLENNKVDVAIAYLKYHSVLGSGIKATKHLIETGCQPLISWLINSKEHFKHFSTYDKSTMMHITSPEVMKLYLKKINISTKDDNILHYLFIHLIKHNKQSELIDIISSVPNYDMTKINLTIRNRLEEVLRSIAINSYNQYFSRHFEIDNGHDKSRENKIKLNNEMVLVEFDRIWQNYGSDMTVLYRLENDTAKGICAKLLCHINSGNNKKLVELIIRKYNIRNITTILTDCKRLDCSATDIVFIKKWLEGFKF